jgi:hypothetical protein
VPGCPDIGATILSKIDAASAFVADVTIVGQTIKGKPTPNPNVLVELGYALSSLGWDRIVLVMNTAFGGPDLLPFDLRQKRAMLYSSPADAPERAPERRALQGKLKGALTAILKAPVPAPPSSPVELSLGYENVSIGADVHHYELQAALKNVGKKRFDDWILDVEFPTPLLEPGVVVGIKVDDRSDGARSLFRTSNQRLRKPILPGEDVTIRFGYRIDRAIYDRRDELYPQVVRMRALVDGVVAGVVEKTIKELQNY